jgi:hypothetical protein
VVNITGSARFASAVKRYHTWPTIMGQTNGDHTYNVIRIYCEVFGPPSWEVLQYLLYHDSPEVASGDVPFPAKMENPDLKTAHDEADARWYMKLFGYDPADNIDRKDKMRCKVADLLEMWEFGMIEMGMGNTYAKPIVDRTLAAARLWCLELYERDKVNLEMYVEMARSDIV